MQLVDRVMALGAAVRYAALAHDADIDSCPLDLFVAPVRQSPEREPTQVVDPPAHRRFD